MRNPLGKGLSELLSEGAGEDIVQQVRLLNLAPNRFQPRRTFDQAQLEELAQTIRDSGILQPLLARRLGHDKFEIIAGERRFRAAKLAGLSTVPVILRQAEDDEMLALALVENLQREDINAGDAAIACKQLSETFGLTQEQIAARLGKTRGQISNSLRLLALPDPIFMSLRHGDISEGHARAILAVADEPMQHELHKQIVSEGLSVRESERRARALRKGPPAQRLDLRPRNPDWRRLEETLSEHFGALVQLHRAGAGGRLTIPFFDEADLSRILERIGLPPST